MSLPTRQDGVENRDKVYWRIISLQVSWYISAMIFFLFPKGSDNLTIQENCLFPITKKDSSKRQCEFLNVLKLSGWSC